MIKSFLRNAINEDRLSLSFVNRDLMRNFSNFDENF